MTLVVASGVTSLVGVARADDDAPPVVHIDLDFAVAQTVVDFIGSSDVLPDCVPPLPCGVPGFTATTARTSASIGLVGLNLEASLTLPIDLVGMEFLTWSVGVRIDTSQDGWLSAQIRLAYIGRWGDVEGQGGRAGIGIILRPAWWLSAYAEAAAEASSVPGSFNEAGALLSYATLLGGGIRFAFGR